MRRKRRKRHPGIDTLSLEERIESQNIESFAPELGDEGNFDAETLIEFSEEPFGNGKARHQLFELGDFGLLRDVGLDFHFLVHRVELQAYGLPALVLLLLDSRKGLDGYGI